MWLRLDNSKADDVEEAKKKYKMYVRRGLNPLFKTNEEGVVDVKAATTPAAYIDSMPTRGHIVYAAAKNYKRFGHFVGSTGNGDALVIFANMPQMQKLKASEVISM